MPHSTPFHPAGNETKPNPALRMAKAPDVDFFTWLPVELFFGVSTLVRKWLAKMTEMAVLAKMAKMTQMA